MAKIGRKKTILAIASLLPLLLVLVFFSFIHQSSYDDFMKTELSFNKEASFSITDSSGIEFSSSPLSFSANEIISSIEELSSKSGRTGFDLEPVYNQFKIYLDSNFSGTCSLDTLNALINTSEDLKIVELISTKNKMIYTVIRSSLLNKISNDLNQLVLDDKAIKFTFKFKSLFRRCTKENYNPGILDSSSEKVLYNIINNKYAYLINRFWLRISVLKKTILFSGLFLVLFTSGYGSYKFIKKIKLNKNGK